MTTLARALRQTKPFRSLEEEVYLSLRLTSQEMDQPWIQYLRGTAGISPSQYNLLRILRGAGEAGRTMGEISDRMINRDPDVTRLADRTVRLGLARRRRDPDDRRVVKLFITPRGLTLLASLDPVVERFIQQALGGLGKARLRALRDLLEAVRAGFRPFPDDEDQA